MMKRVALAVAALVTAAHADPNTQPNTAATPHTQVVNADNLFSISVSNTRNGTPANIRITFLQDINYTYGFPNAVAFNIDLAAAAGWIPEPAHIYGLEWDLTHTALSPSWLSEFRIEFTDKDMTTGFSINPSSTNTPGTETNTSGGLVDLISLGHDFYVQPPHILLTLWDTVDDFGGGVEGILHAGSTMTLAVKFIPAPSTLTLLCIGSVAAMRRRR
ncbi:MAG: PEP-CTERM sorting domain-containing protein [Phycisphaeraceae bacterium]|nr:PEP-CTERM sorting domain-containing protein [Phycisphaeraceae bacterium]MCW5762867.1 PEP-CTERM sorting domain-containing protein [Phycisphaeraceae bacterium]